MTPAVPLTPGPRTPSQATHLSIHTVHDARPGPPVFVMMMVLAKLLVVASR
jgi:hypothetical protein